MVYSTFIIVFLIRLNKMSTIIKGYMCGNGRAHLGQ